MTIVNIKIIGWEQFRALGGVYCGRPSPLGNPYRLWGKEPRGATIERYRTWLWEKIKARDEKVMKELAALTEESVLGCWCTPNPCHCEVIERAWRWLKAERVI